VLMHREPGGIWRIDYRLPDGESPEQALNPESLTARINAQLAMIGAAGKPWTLDWSSVYSARALTLPDYFCGRVGFVGDAAHVLPIFGVRGANTGAQDCQNLAWKLACVVRGWAGATLLNSYSAERVQAAREIIHEASRSTRFMTPPTRGYRLLRDATLSLSLSQSFVQPLLHWRTSRPHEYPDSPLNADDSEDSFLGCIEIGAPVKNIRLGPDSYLLDQLSADFHLIYVGGRSIPAWVAPAVDEIRRHGPTLRLITDPERIGAQLGVGEGWYLVRPDQHVCGRWRQLDAARLRAAMDRALSRVSGERHV
jgi:3-(3-hydroxy-phenyl)propionate hydroxylase